MVSTSNNPTIEEVYLNAKDILIKSYGAQEVKNLGRKAQGVIMLFNYFGKKPVMCKTILRDGWRG